MNRQETLLVCLGLLFGTSSVLVNDWIHLPDYLKGFLIGLGIALEFIGLIIYARRMQGGRYCENSNARDEII